MATLWRRDINLHFTGEEMEFDSSQTSEHILQVACFLFDPKVHSLFPLPASSHWKLKALSWISECVWWLGTWPGWERKDNRTDRQRDTEEMCFNFISLVFSITGFIDRSINWLIGSPRYWSQSALLLSHTPMATRCFCGISLIVLWHSGDCQ